MKYRKSCSCQRNPALPTHKEARNESERLLKKWKKYKKSDPSLAFLFSDASNAWIRGWAPGPSGMPVGMPAETYSHEWTWTKHFFGEAKKKTAKAEEAEKQRQVKSNPRSEAERREFEREVAAWEAKKDLERALNWERYQCREEEEAGGRRKVERRRNPGVEQVVLLVLPYVIKSLGNKVSAFNGLSQSERERRVREFLRGSQRHLMGPAGSLLGPQAAKSDKIVRAIVAAVERHGGHAVQAGGEAATARLTSATRNPRRR